MLPFDLRQFVRTQLEEENRPNDGKLHASSHLVGSLRHAMLDVAGAPKVPQDTAGMITLKTGTLWHRWFNEAYLSKGVPVMQEVKLDKYLPEGWSGTADWIFWSDEYKAFVLGDLKSVKGDGIHWVLRGGAKVEHKHQLSVYWHALAEMGLPLVKGLSVLYLPKNAVIGKTVEPEVIEFDPLDKDYLHKLMQERFVAVRSYKDSLRQDYLRQHASSQPARPLNYVNQYLAPVQERVQKLFKGGDLKLVPHWSAAYCSFPDELCDCSTQGTTKIGHYLEDGEYVPRKGYEHIKPELTNE